MLPVQASVAVAPGSANELWRPTLNGLGPVRVITGLVVSTTFTVRVVIAVLALASVAL